MSIIRADANGHQVPFKVQVRTSDTVIQWVSDLRVNIDHFVSVTIGGDTFTDFTMAYSGNPDDHQNGSLTLNSGTFSASVVFNLNFFASYHNDAEGNYYLAGPNTFTDVVNVINLANDSTVDTINQQGFTNLTFASSDSKDTETIAGEAVTGFRLNLTGIGIGFNQIQFQESGINKGINIRGGLTRANSFKYDGTNWSTVAGSNAAEVGKPVVDATGGLISIARATTDPVPQAVTDIINAWNHAQSISTIHNGWVLQPFGTTSINFFNSIDTDLSNYTITNTGQWVLSVTIDVPTTLPDSFNPLKPNEAYTWNWGQDSTLTIDAGKTFQFANAALPLMSAKDGTFNITDGSRVELTTQVKRFIPGSIDSNGDGSQTVAATTANPFTLNIKNNSTFQINNITSTNFSDQGGSGNTFLGTPNSVSTRNLIGTFENSSLVDTSDGQTLVYPLASSTYNNFTILLDKGGTSAETVSNQFFLTCNPNARIRDSFKVVNTGFPSRFKFTGIAAANNILADGSTYAINKANTIAGSLNSQLIWYRFNLVNASTTKLGLYNPGNINFIFINPELNNEPYYGKCNFIFRHPTNDFRDGNVWLATQYNPIFIYDGSALNKINEEIYYGSTSNSTLTTVKEASETGLIGTVGTQYNDATGVTISSTFGLADVNYTANEATAGTNFTSTNSNNNGLNLTFLRTVTEASGTEVNNKDYDPQDTHFFSYQKRDGFRPTFPRYSFADGAQEALIIEKDATIDKYWQNTTVAAIDSYVELLGAASVSANYKSLTNTLEVDLDLDTDQETVDTFNIGVPDAAVIKNVTPGDYSIFITNNSGINVNDIHILTNGAAEYTATVISTGINGQIDINVSTADSALIDAVAGSKTSGGFTYWSATAGFGLDIKAHRIDWNDIYKTIEYLENNNLITNANLTSETRPALNGNNGRFARFIDTDTPVDTSNRINMPNYNIILNIKSSNLNVSSNDNAITGINVGTNDIIFNFLKDTIITANINCNQITTFLEDASNIINYKTSTITTQTNINLVGNVTDNSVINIIGDLVIKDVTNSILTASNDITLVNTTNSTLNSSNDVTITGVINTTDITASGELAGKDVNSSNLNIQGDITIDDADKSTLISGADMTVKDLVDSTATAGATYGGSTNTRSTINSTGNLTMTNEVIGTSTNKAIMNVGANATFGQTITNGDINGTSSSIQTVTLNGSSFAAPHMSVMVTGTNVNAIVNTPIEDSDVGTASTRVNDADFHNDARVIDTNAYATNTIDLPTVTNNGIFDSVANIVQTDTNGTVSNSTLKAIDINIKAMTGGSITASDDVTITSANGTNINCNDSLTNSGDFTNVNVTTAILAVNDIKGTSVITTSGNSTINEIESGNITFNGSTSTSTIGTISGGTITSNNTHQLDITTIETGTFIDGEFDVTNFVQGGTYTDLTFEDVKTNTKATAHTGVYNNVDMELTNEGSVTLGGSGNVTATRGPDAEIFTDKYVQTGSDRTQFLVLTTTGGDINDTITIFSEGVEIVNNAHLFDTPELTGTRAGGYRYTIDGIIYEQTQTLQQDSPPLFIYGITKVDIGEKVIINPQLVNLTIVPDNGTNNTRHIIRAELPFDVNINTTGATNFAYKINNGNTIFGTVGVTNIVTLDESNVDRGEDIEFVAMGKGFNPRRITFTVDNIPENGNQIVDCNLTAHTYDTSVDTDPSIYVSTNFNSSNELVMTIANIRQNPVLLQRLVLDNIYTSNDTLNAMLFHNTDSIVTPFSTSLNINTEIVKLNSSTATTLLLKETAPLIKTAQTTIPANIRPDEIKFVNQNNFVGISHLAAAGATFNELQQELNKQFNGRLVTSTNEQRKGKLIPVDTSSSQIIE